MSFGRTKLALALAMSFAVGDGDNLTFKKAEGFRDQWRCIGKALHGMAWRDIWGVYFMRNEVWCGFSSPSLSDEKERECMLGYGFLDLKITDNPHA